jgi:hypothetical protein
MTLKQRWLDMLIAWCEVGQKEHAWKKAKQLAEDCPHELSELPDALTQTMRQRLHVVSTESGGKSDPQPLRKTQGR